MTKADRKEARRAEGGLPRLWRSSTLAPAVAGGALVWAALPPCHLAPLAFLGPVAWVTLIRQSQLRGGRPYAALWCAGCLFWLAALHWLRLPHWLTIFGWIAMGIYMGCYLPLFVGLARVAVHRLRVPVVVAAPVVWMGLELAQGHMLTGFTMGHLGQTQYRWVALIQISDLAGVYGVGFIVMFVAACLARALPLEGQPACWWPLAPAAALLAAVLTYGHLRMVPPGGKAAARVVLVQGSIDTVLEPEPGSREKMHSHYYELTREAMRRFGRGGVDLIVWPETVFYGWLVTEPGGAGKVALEAKLSPRQRTSRANLLAMDQLVRQEMKRLAAEFGAPMLVGVNRKEFTPEGVNNYNAAALVRRHGQVAGVYDKMHLVMFGEYIPLADRLPWLVQATPLNRLGIALQPGRRPVAFRVKGLWIAPNICYESVLPHLIRRQINVLEAQGRPPQVLVNLTNDGWFWGSSELDMHLACAVLRAVECRKPFLIAANTGFSAWIDADGRIRAQGPRRAP
ncbi:MAG TPA: apolipoprotein N-acyltransferase, partial [Planctomycetes bacterium]|nr:apolipoprotein N-acyltransferase [Planctomycetota bacterium]